MSDEVSLEKHYVEGCPGCRVDIRKQASSRLSVKNLVSLWIVVLCNELPMSSLYPFIYFMVRDFHVAERDEDIEFISFCYMKIPYLHSHHGKGFSCSRKR
ncbi:hypothetical protein QQ045_009340 [Rhodiola kirilowii]